MTRSAKKGLKHFCAEKYFMFVTHFPTGSSYLQQVLTNEGCRASGAKVLFSFFSCGNIIVSYIDDSYDCWIVPSATIGFETE